MQEHLRRISRASRSARFLATLGTLAFAGCSQTPGTATLGTEPDPIVRSMDLLAGAAVGDGTLVGVSVAVLRGDRTVVERGYGTADLEHAVPATQATRYYVGSITKPFTAAAILRLADQGLLDLDDDVSRHVPELDSPGAPVTLRQLLNHTSGLAGPPQVGHRFIDRRHLDFSRAELIELLKGEPRVSPPGERMVYNNLGYLLLGIVVERVSGWTYERYLADELLGGSATSLALCDARAVIPNRARGYEVRDGTAVHHEPVNASLLFAAGGICATAGDVARAFRSLIAGGVLSAEALRQMTTPERLGDGSTLPYGYGVFVGGLEGHTRVHHGGVVNGFSGHVAHYPDQDVTVVVLTNTRSGAAQRLESEIAHRLLGVPVAK
jgi:D-alanyl-D-alanine carboxypeptidase